jgi:hypothetical protein
MGLERHVTRHVCGPAGCRAGAGAGRGTGRTPGASTPNTPGAFSLTPPKLNGMGPGPAALDAAAARGRRRAERRDVTPRATRRKATDWEQTAAIGGA